MDTFMDKLAHKLTAQEMIKANTAAETAELNRLKKQIEEYDVCLSKLQALLEDGRAKFEDVRVDDTQLAETVNRLVEEGISKINAVQQDSAELAGAVTEAVGEKFTDVMNQATDSIAERAAEELNAVLAEKFENSNENVHKECVKVYRNVQAVVVEESGKQTEGLDKLGAEVKKFKVKVNVILGVSIAALVMAAGGVALQVLYLLNFKLF